MNNEIIYREAYTEGYQQAIKDVTAYKVSKTEAKKFSLIEWKKFEDEYYEDFCTAPQATKYSFHIEKKPELKFIYIIRMKKKGITFEEELRYKEGSFFKIGITRNLRSRLQSLQTSSPVPLEVFFKYRSHHAETIETKLHDHFKESNTSGEWFILDENNMRDFLNNKFPVIVQQIERKNT